MFGSFVLSFNLKVSEITTFQGPTPFVFCTSTPLVVVSRHGCDHRHCGKWKEKKEEVFAPQRIRHLRCSTVIYLLFIFHIDLIFILQIHLFHHMSRIWGIPFFFRYWPWFLASTSKNSHWVSEREAPWTLDLDADNDGQISPDELMKDFQRVHFRADVMLERVSLEDGLLGFMQQTFGI